MAISGERREDKINTQSWAIGAGEFFLVSSGKLLQVDGGEIVA